MKREDTSNFIEGNDWGLSYQNLGSFISFPSFVIGLIWLGLVVKLRVSILNPGYCNRDLNDQSKTSTFTFQLTPPLRSRSRVDFGGFFDKQGYHRLSPTSGLSMSIRHDLYFVCKVASVWLISLTITDTSYPQFLSKFVQLHRSSSYLIQILIRISYWLNLLRLVGFPCCF